MMGCYIYLPVETVRDILGLEELSYGDLREGAALGRPGRDASVESM
jgi:hypothetical protein